MISQRGHFSLALFICILIACIGTVSAGTYSGGDGSSGTPYLLSSDSDIDELSSTSADWSKYFQLTNDITLVGNHTPIGDGSTQFTGDFDGNGSTISNLTVYNTGGLAGFFGYTNFGANIHDLGVETSSDGVVSTTEYVGGLVGCNIGGTISNCSSTGIVTGSGQHVGGLVGYAEGTVSNSYANVTVTGSSYHVGGLIGAASEHSVVSNCYATGNVISGGDQFTGGLIGRIWVVAVSNCYATGNVTGVQQVGGLIGYNEAGTVSNSFATGTVDGTSDYGALIGLNVATVTNSYYSGTPASGAGTSTSYANFMDFAFVSGASGLNWNGSGDIITTEENTSFIWRIIDGYTLPYLQYQNVTYSGGSGTVDDPYLLSSDSDIDELSATSADWGMNFTLTQDITLVGNHTPIGKTAPYFTGDFNGNGHSILNLTVYETTNYAGFFGVTIGANIYDLRVEASSDGVVTTGGYAGVLIGDNYGTVTNSSATGNATVSLNYAGGLVGTNNNGGTLSNCYATGNVTGASYVGGLAGENANTGSVSNSFATGNVTGASNYAGGLVGYNLNTISNCYANSIVTGSGEVGGLVGENGNTGTIGNSYATGDVTGSGDSVGGVLGKNWGAISNCYATGNATTGSQYVGGLVGQNAGSATVSKSFATGTATGTSNGGLVGYLSGGSVTDGYYSGTPVTGEGTSTSYVNFLSFAFVSDTGLNWNASGTQNVITTADNSGYVWKIISGYTLPYFQYQEDPISLAGTPESFTNITGNFWVNHSWSAGAGDLTDSYNVSYDGNWQNSTVTYFNHTGLSAHAWSNITVYAYNATDSTLSAGAISRVQIPNNVISILNVTDITTGEGASINFDINFTDADGDTATFGCNQSSLFDDFNTSTGIGSWNISLGEAGTYNVEFNVSDGYGSIDSQIMFITVEPISAPESFTNTTGNFWVNHSWNAGTGIEIDSYNVSYNASWLNGTTNSFNHTALSAHAWSNITVYAYNITYSVLSAGANSTVQVPNNEISILDVTNITSSEGETINFDINFTDVDGDTATFGCNRSSLFDDFNTSTGEGLWSANINDSGIYYVEFNVSDGYGSVDSQVMTITINDVITPVADFTASTGSGYVPLTVVFTDNSSNTPTSWFWDFGDGTNSTSQNPTHSFSSTGTYYVNLNASNFAGSNLSSNMTITVTDVPSSSSSSSGTRASVSQGQDPKIVSQSASSVKRVTGGSKVNYDFSDSGTPVLRISFDAKKDKGLVVAKVQVLSSAPEGVPSPSGNSYQMMSIDVGNEGTISSDSADNVMISFKVSKQWIEDNNIDVSTIRMTRYNDDQWNDLPTSQKSEDGEYFYFYAETPGFSIFSVLGDEVSDTPADTVESSATSVAEEVDEPVEEEETSSTPGFTALTGVVFVSLAFLVSRKQK
ncbi:PGF-pre-PGF domain-containing protein [Methanolobus mangrovi]|uniref:PGF-pre-PGF domain-containing protein n=1 Tax=Methanolobus mangrovi TaxID=3072977 RepID=A0AA51UH76_9EURY|nr:GLUG motif-containing protein [Methanolobus mangrovi]WMW23121.1 PGF-pre-PGF domain-containing protein [Methanolobus mangrovi]